MPPLRSDKVPTFIHSILRAGIFHQTRRGSGRGRDAGYPTPPARIHACRITAHGSYLGSLRQTAVQAKDVVSLPEEAIG